MTASIGSVIEKHLIPDKHNDRRLLWISALCMTTFFYYLIYLTRIPPDSFLTDALTVLCMMMSAYSRVLALRYLPFSPIWPEKVQSIIKIEHLICFALEVVLNAEFSFPVLTDEALEILLHITAFIILGIVLTNIAVLFYVACTVDVLRNENTNVTFSANVVSVIMVALFIPLILFIAMLPFNAPEFYVNLAGFVLPLLTWHPFMLPTK